MPEIRLHGSLIPATLYQRTENRGQMTEDRSRKWKFGLRGIGPMPRREVGKFGRQMSGFIFTPLTYSTLSTNQPYIPATLLFLLYSITRCLTPCAPVLHSPFRIPILNPSVTCVLPSVICNLTSVTRLLSSAL